MSRTKEQRRELNRANASKSTGPKSEGGKQHARLNALKHRLLSSPIFLPHQDAATVARVRAGGAGCAVLAVLPERPHPAADYVQWPFPAGQMPDGVGGGDSAEWLPEPCLRREPVAEVLQHELPFLGEAGRRLSAELDVH